MEQLKTRRTMLLLLASGAASGCTFRCMGGQPRRDNAHALLALRPDHPAGHRDGHGDAGSVCRPGASSIEGRDGRGDDRDFVGAGVTASGLGSVRIVAAATCTETLLRLQPPCLWSDTSSSAESFGPGCPSSCAFPVTLIGALLLLVDFVVHHVAFPADFRQSVGLASFIFRRFLALAVFAGLLGHTGLNNVSALSTTACRVHFSDHGFRVGFHPLNGVF